MDSDDEVDPEMERLKERARETYEAIALRSAALDADRRSRAAATADKLRDAAWTSGTSRDCCAGSCVSFHEPKPANETIDAQGPSRQGRKLAVAALHEIIGKDRLAMIKSMGALEQLEKMVLPLTTDDLDFDLLPVQQWVDTDIELTLDSGCCEHVIDVGDIKGYASFVTESPGSRRGQNFIVGNGDRVSNDGQCVLNLEQDGLPIQSTFQIAGITRPLMSVGRVCDQGLRCNFDDKQALVVDSNNRTVCRFERRGGLYVAKLKLKSPELFARPAA